MVMKDKSETLSIFRTKINLNKAVRQDEIKNPDFNHE